MRKRVPFSTKSSPSLRCSTYVMELASAIAGIAPPGKRRIEQQPGIRRVRRRILKRKMRAAQECSRRRQDSRIARLVEIQATCIVAGPQAEGDEVDTLERRDVEGVAARRRY